MEQKNKAQPYDGLKNLIYNVFCAIVFLIPIFPTMKCVGGISVINILFIAVTFMTVAILAIIDIKENILKFTIYDLIIAAYGLTIVISTITSKYGFAECLLGTNGRGEGTLTLLSYAATFVICSKGYRHIEKTYKIGLTGATIVAVYAILQACFNLPFGDAKDTGIAVGTMGNQNFLASYLMLFLPMMYYYFLNKKDNKSLIVMLLLAVALVFTKTLSCYTTFILMCILISVFSLWFNKDKKETVLRILAIIVIVLTTFAIICVFKGDMYVSELIGIKQEMINLAESKDTFATGRMLVWKKTLKVINNNRYFGVGPDSLKMELANDEYASQTRDWTEMHIIDKAHSEYLQIAATTGLISLGLYVILILCVCLGIIRILFKTKKYRINNDNIHFIIMTLIAIVSYLGQAIGNISVIQVAPVYWAILGFGAGITINEKISKNKLCQ